MIGEEGFELRCHYTLLDETKMIRNCSEANQPAKKKQEYSRCPLKYANPVSKHTNHCFIVLDILGL